MGRLTHTVSSLRVVIAVFLTAMFLAQAATYITIASLLTEQRDAILTEMRDPTGEGTERYLLFRRIEATMIRAERIEQKTDRILEILEGDGG